MTVGGSWGSSADDVWFADSGGRLLHWDGAALSVEPSVSSANLTAVWGTAPDDAWAVSLEGTILHWNGMSWRHAAETGASLSGVWAADRDAAWAVGRTGDDGAIFHWDGQQWRRLAADLRHCGDTLRSAWGRNRDDVWFVDCNAAAPSRSYLHWNGASLDWVPRHGSYPMNTLYGAGNVLWVAGGAEVVAWDGSAWSTLYSAGHLRDVWARTRDDVWVVGDDAILHFNGQSWSQRDAPVQMRGVWAASATDVFAIGENGTILRGDGHNWTVMRSDPKLILQSLWGSSADDLWVLHRDGGVLHWDGKTWSSTALGDPYIAGSIRGTSANDVWVTSWKTAHHWDGSGWHQFAFPLKGGYTVGLWANASDDYWAITDYGELLRWDGHRWSVATQIAGGSFLDHNGVWGTSATDLWVAHDGLVGGALSHWDGNGWTCSTDGNQFLAAIHGAPDGGSWAVGGFGTILHHVR